MDPRKLVTLVSQCPPLWDRNHDRFRDQELKSNLWNQVGNELKSTGSACREAFKTLREKYVRERDKVQQYGNTYKTWELFDLLQFLEPHIITRKQSCSYPDDFVVIKHDPISKMEDFYSDSDNYNNLTENDSCRALVKLVHDMKPLWDRQSKDHNSKQNRDQLWKIIAATLKSDANTCALRWKGLREKYIRQKQKYIEGEAKWELLDDLSFLDNVIQYRKKTSFSEENSRMSLGENHLPLLNVSSDNELSDDRTNDSTPNQPSSSTNGYQQIILNHSLFSPANLKNHTPDSTLDPAHANLRKRTVSNASETAEPKKTKSEDFDKSRTPEEIFGEFVSSMLSIKSDKDKSAAMMEIMSILTK